ncbi:hypothetical protein Tco_1364390 [Tanacetum coccineum]
MFPKRLLLALVVIKTKGVEPTIKVSKSNPFEVLNSVDNDEELGTNKGTINLVNNDANSSGSSFMNIDNNSIVYPGDHDSEDEVASVDNDMARDLASEMTGFSNQSLLEK